MPSRLGALALAFALALPAAMAHAQKPKSAPTKAAPKPAAKPAAPAASPAPAPAASATPAPPTTAVVSGTVLDSLHAAVLAGALVRVDRTTREAATDPLGRFRIDSIPPGDVRLIVHHPLLDTLGITLVTPMVTLAAGEDRTIDLAVPSPATLVGFFCTPAQRLRGPAALVGAVRDPDTGEAAVGAKVSLLWYESDPLGLKKTPRIREVTIDSTGFYRICGLPEGMSGKVQLFRKGVSSGEVPVELAGELLGLRSLSIASNVHVVTSAPSDTGKQPQRFLRGRARVTGRVVNKTGQPVVGARVSVQGSGMATVTRGNGEFVLDSLPSGTQTLEVRQLGYSPTERAVELSVAEAPRVTVRMDDYVPVLQTMRVTAARERGLQDVGFSDRKRHGANGHFLEGDQINTHATQFSDVLRVVPGIRVQPVGNGQNVITSTRDATGGCVTFVVDGSPWQQMTPGDIDTFVRPEEIAAIEVYTGSGAPPQFQQAGMSSCSVVVVWTERRVTRSAKR